jgi:hypothetical protein
VVEASVFYLYSLTALVTIADLNSIYLILSANFAVLFLVSHVWMLNFVISVKGSASWGRAAKNGNL